MTVILSILGGSLYLEWPAPNFSLLKCQLIYKPIPKPHSSLCSPIALSHVSAMALMHPAR